jgi:lysozyme
MSTILDVSNANGAISYPTAKKHVAGVIAKATEGRTYTDLYFSRNRRLAGAAGLPFGAYHFARPDHNGARDEAQHFASVVKAVGPTDIKPVLDFEQRSNLPAADQEAWIRDFMDEIKGLLGLYPMFYSYTYFIRTLGLKTTVGNGLWLADYGSNDGKPHPVTAPSPWLHVALHQYTSRGTCPGVSGYVDLSIGNLSAILNPAGV